MVANIFITDVIGKDTTTEDVRGQYALYKNPSEIMVHIDSVGGDVRQGYAIHDFLRNTGKKITTKIEGRCYSIATIIALAGDERLMTPFSEIMIHNPWSKSDGGDSRHYLKIASQLIQAEKEMAEFYSSKTGVGLIEVKALMAKETYLKADKAKQLGFITEEKEKLKAVAKFNNMEKEKEKEARSLLGDIKKLLGMGDEPKEEPKAMIESELADGTKIVIDSEDGDVVGKTVMVDVDGDMTPAPSGKHTLADGRVITVEDGVISEIEEAAPDAKKDDDEMAKMKEEMEALKAENESLKAEKEEAIQAKAKELEAFKAENDEKFKVLGEKMNQLNALVITEDAPKALKKNVGQEPAKHKFDNLIAK